MTRRWTFVAVKAFGDLVIAHGALRRAGSDPRLGMLVGLHLRELHAQLAPPFDAELIDHGSDDVPALFDVRRRGWRRAVSSANRLRDAIRRSNAASRGTLVFDRLAFRERWIAGRSACESLPARANIYDAHLAYLAERDLVGDARPPQLRSAGREVGIFPGSRVARKHIPWPLVEQVATRLERRGWRPRVCTVAGEPSYTSDAFPSVRLERTFASLAAALRSVDRIVAADSLAAHLGEHLGRPTFVIAPAANHYWLPHASFHDGHHATFGEAAALATAVDRFCPTG